MNANGRFSNKNSNASREYCLNFLYGRLHRDSIMTKTTITISVTNQKGGVAKTTTTANLAAALGDLGRRVLMIDLDPQSHLSVLTGTEVGDDENTVVDWLFDNNMSLEAVTRREVMPNVDLIPSAIDLAGAELRLAMEMQREAILKQRLTSAKGLYDYILIDNKPDLSQLVLNGLVAADFFLVPTEPSYLCLKAIVQLGETIRMVVERGLNPKLQLAGVLITKYDKQIRQHQEVIDILAEEYGTHLLATRIARTVKYDYATAAHSPIYFTEPSSIHRAGFDDLAKEIETRVR